MPEQITRVIPIKLALGTIVIVQGKRYTVVRVAKRVRPYKVTAFRTTLEVAS